LNIINQNSLSAWEQSEPYLCGMTLSHCRAKTDPEINALNADAWKLRAYKQPQHNLWIQGDPGTGKTFLARCLLRDYIDPPGVGSGRMIAALDEFMFHNLAHDFDVVRKVAPYRDAGLLLLDDVDKVEWNHKSLSLLKHILGYRYDWQEPTILTGNINPEGFRTILLEGTTNPAMVTAILDRLVKNVKVELTGPSHR